MEEDDCGSDPDRGCVANTKPRVVLEDMVVGSRVGANQLAACVNAMNEMGKIFGSSVKLEKKSFKFQPMALAA